MLRILTRGILLNRSAIKIDPTLLLAPTQPKQLKTSSLIRCFSVSTTFKSQQPKIIDDLNKENKSGDDLLRCKLAAIYRLVDQKGWNWSVYNHITVRSTENDDHFFINPYGLFYEEVTASSLL